MIKLIKKDSRKPIQPTAASFLVTENCNLGCTYCFECHNNNNMSFEVAEQGVKWLFNNARENINNGHGEQDVHILLFGGEPTLRPKTLDKILCLAFKLMRETGIKATASMITNATVLTSEVKEVILEYKDKLNLSVQLSVDGIKEVQNMYRITKDGHGSFELVEKNIEDWKRLFKNDFNRLSIHGCCNKKTLPYLYENYLFFREEWGLKKIWFMPIHSEHWSKEDVIIYEEQLSKILDYILDKAKETNSVEEVDNYAPIDKCLINQQKFTTKACGAGCNFVTITANGEVFPCHHIYFNDKNRELYIGNIFDGIDDTKRQIFLEYDTNTDFSCVKENPECDCYGCYRCIAENWVENGSILSQIRGFRCQMSKSERKIQLKLREELINMGLLNRGDFNLDIMKGNNPNNPACLCDVDADGGYINQEERNKFNYEEEYRFSENLEIIARALEITINKLCDIEENQKFILKKLL